MAHSIHLHQSLIHITAEYLGPAAPRFIERQVRYHLKKDPETLGMEDMDELISWLKAAMTVLTKDNKLVRQYEKSLVELSGN